MTGRPQILVLAAGRGLRFRGVGHKLQQDLGGQSVLARTVAHALSTGLSVMAVTTDGLAPMLRQFMAERDVLVLREVSPHGKPLPLGMGYSIAAGVSATGDAEGWVILPGDMPNIQPSSILAVSAALRDQPVSYAQYKGQRGHPVGFGSELFSELAELQGDEGARRLMARYPSVGVEVGDPGVLADIDTLDDLQRVREQIKDYAVTRGSAG